MSDTCLEKFRSIDTGFISDAMSALGIDGWLNGLHPANEEHTICGRAFTIQFSDDMETYPASYNIFELLEKAEPGDVIILSANSSGSACGEKVMHAVEQLGLQAIVTDGPTRDHRVLDKMDTPIFSAGVTNRVRTGTFVPRAYQIPVRCAGIFIKPGDVIIGDVDGVIAIPSEQADAVLSQSEWVKQMEEQMEEVISECYSAEKLKLLSKMKKQLRQASE